MNGFSLFGGLLMMVGLPPVLQGIYSSIINPPEYVAGGLAFIGLLLIVIDIINCEEKFLRILKINE